MDDITPLQQLSEDAMKTDAQLLDIRPATAWINDIQRAVLVEGAKHFRGQNPSRGTAISYWLKSAPAGAVRITIADITGREIRSLEGTKNAGLNRVQWDLALAGGRGRGGRGGGSPAAAPPAPPATPQPGQPAAGPQAPQNPPAAARGGGGRGGFGAAVPPGSYLVKLMIGDTVAGQKTLVVEPDAVQ
jgi:hypothetical protein